MNTNGRRPCFETPLSPYTSSYRVFGREPEKTEVLRGVEVPGRQGRPRGPVGSGRLIAASIYIGGPLLPGHVSQTSSVSFQKGEGDGAFKKSGAVLLDFRLNYRGHIVVHPDALVLGLVA